jgi:hypothetical protein
MMVPALAFAWWFAAVPAQDSVAAAQPAQEIPSMEQAPKMDAPPGWHETGPTPGRMKVKLVSPAMVQMAEKFVKLPLGSERYATVDGKRYVFVLERHYHPPGFQGAPNGWHKGVTMYELKDGAN